MTTNIGHVALLLGVIFSPFANGAQADPGDFAGNRLWLLQRLSPVERAQYASGNYFDGNENCWDLYQTNCPTPHDTNPIQDLHDGYSWYPAAANHYRGAPEARLRPGRATTSFGLQGRGVPALDDFGGASAGFHSLHSSGLPAVHNFGGAGGGFHGLRSSGLPASAGFMGYAPAFHGFGGGQGYDGFGGAGGFHGGGGGAFSLGGHGGIGHR